MSSSSSSSSSSSYSSSSDSSSSDSSACPAAPPTAPEAAAPLAMADCGCRLAALARSAFFAASRCAFASSISFSTAAERKAHRSGQPGTQYQPRAM
eukprot:1050045-Prymnesium_polylepis.1